MATRGPYHSRVARSLSHGTLALVLVACAPTAALGATWSASGSAAASWSGGWPSLDLRARGGLVLAGGHEIGLVTGITSERLDTRLLYLSHYTHTWTGIESRVWPAVSLWLGGATDLLGAWAQSRLLFGSSVGLRLPVGELLALRLDLGLEALAGDTWVGRVFLAFGLEILGGPGWPR